MDETAQSWAGSDVWTSLWISFPHPTLDGYGGCGLYRALRGSFVSLLIQEGHTVVDVAAQAGHTPETCLGHYARLFRDAPAERVSAEVAIKQARDVFRCSVGRGADAAAASGGKLG
jgi:hypothetical protein